MAISSPKSLFSLLFTGKFTLHASPNFAVPDQIYRKYLAFTLLWIHFAWTAQLTTTFPYNLENVFVLCCWLLAGNAQGHFFLPIYLLLIVYLFLLLELFGNFTRRAFQVRLPLLSCIVSASIWERSVNPLKCHVLFKANPVRGGAPG